MADNSASTLYDKTLVAAPECGMVILQICVGQALPLEGCRRGHVNRRQRTAANTESPAGDGEDKA